MALALVVQKITNAVAAKPSVADLEAELAALRETNARRKAEADQLAEKWLKAQSRGEAEEFEARRRELLRQVERDALLMPAIEQRLVDAKAAALRAGLAKHQRRHAEIYGRLRGLIEGAARVQVEAVLAREGAEKELGGDIVSKYLPRISFRGILLPDLVSLWSNEMDRVFANPLTMPPVRPRAAAADPRPAGAGDAARGPVRIIPPVAAAEAPPPKSEPQPPPRPRRQPRRDTADEGQRLISILRAGAEVNGEQAVAGDQIAVPPQLATQLVQAGAADFAEDSHGKN